MANRYAGWQETQATLSFPTGENALIELAFWLARSDNLHLIQWFNRGGADAEMSAYFTTPERWSLRSNTILEQLQQVSKNFIAALHPLIIHSDE